MEGDGPLVFSCYERLATVSNAVAVAAYPNVEGVARRQAVGNLPVYNQLVAKAKACIYPGLQFFQRKFSQEFYENVCAFRSARLCCPVQVQQLRLTAASVEELRRFRFLDNDAIITLPLNFQDTWHLQMEQTYKQKKRSYNGGREMKQTCPTGPPW